MRAKTLMFVGSFIHTSVDFILNEEFKMLLNNMYQFFQINFDNTKLDGQMPIHLEMENNWLKCQDNSQINSSHEEGEFNLHCQCFRIGQNRHA